MKKCKNPLIAEVTKTYVKRIFNLSDIKLPEGLKKCCVWCLEPLTGRKYRWCGEECVEEASAWGNPQKEYGVAILLIRQNFKCNSCAYDWGKVVEGMYNDTNPYVSSYYGMKEAKKTWRTKESYWVARRLKEHVHVTDKPHRLEVDHILAISKGGQSLGLENHQILCYDCHKVKTKQDLSGKRNK